MVDNENRRTLIWVGSNDGMMHALDARTGIEVYAFIPFNLLAKLKALPDGNAIGSPDYFVDSSPKLADVRSALPLRIARTRRRRHAGVRICSSGRARAARSTRRST